MYTGNKGARRRNAALRAEIEHLDRLDKAYDYQQARIDAALEGEELPAPRTLDEARQRAEARLDYYEAEDAFHTPEDPYGLREGLDDAELRAATEAAEAEEWAGTVQTYGLGESSWEPAASGTLTDALEANLYGGNAGSGEGGGE